MSRPISSPPSPHAEPEFTDREIYARLIDQLSVEAIPEGLRDADYGIAGEPTQDEWDIDYPDSAPSSEQNGSPASEDSTLSPEEVLQKYWGYPSFRPQQQEIILSLLDNRDTLGLLPTGGGKSITFQVPALIKPGITLVISPLIALMKDQVDRLRKIGIKAAWLHSGMSKREMDIITDNCLYGGYKFLYISPERLQSELFLETLYALKVSMIVVDECHCISQWGYDFRPSYLNIAQVRDILPQVPILALTATATPYVVQDIMQQLRFREKHVLSVSFFRKNLSYVVRETAHKMETLLHILNQVPGSAIVYCRNRQKTKQIAEALQTAGVSADYFHAGLTYAERELKQNSWMHNDIRVIVATNAFGMGIDKPDVRVVIHWTLPNSIEEYFQEGGRAGRDGGKAYAVALVEDREIKLLKRRVSDSFPPLDFVRKVYDSVCSDLKIGYEEGYMHSYLLDIPHMIQKHSYNPTQFMSALKILEMSGLWELRPEESHSRLIMEVEREELYYRSDLSNGEEHVVMALLRTYPGIFADYVFIDERKIAAEVHQSHSEVYETLVRLSQKEILHYIPQKRLPSILFKYRRESSSTILIPKSVYEQRREALRQRIQAIMVYASTHKHCRSQMLLSYFGDESHKPCRTCDVCTQKWGNGLRRYQLLDVEEWLREQKQKGEKRWSVATLMQAMELQEEHVLAIVEQLCSEHPDYLFDGSVLTCR